MMRELKTFVTVAHLGSFAGAGARLGLTQSAVSAQIQRLEQTLGFTLFERSGRAAKLNAAGRETLPRAEEIVGLFQQLGHPAAAREGGGLVRVGAIASAHVSFLPTAVANFCQAYPDCRLRIVPGVSLNLLGQVDAGEIDIAVMIRPPFALPVDLEWKSLAREPYVMLAPSHAEGDWRSLLETQPFIRYDRASFGGRLVDQFLRLLRAGVRDMIELDELQMILQLVAQGLGVALVPRSHFMAPWPAQVRVLELGEHTFYREIGMVERPRHARQTLASRLAEHISAAMAAPA